MPRSKKQTEDKDKGRVVAPPVHVAPEAGPSQHPNDPQLESERLAKISSQATQERDE